MGDAAEAAINKLQDGEMLLLENVRYRDFIYGDLMSQIGSVKTGKKRLLEMIDDWDAETLKIFSNEMNFY